MQRLRSDFDLSEEKDKKNKYGGNHNNPFKTSSKNCFDLFQIQDFNVNRYATKKTVAKVCF